MADTAVGLLHPFTIGRGVPRVVRVAAPAAGAEHAINVPGEAYWRPLSLRHTFTADANVGTRLPELVFDDGTSVFCRVPAQAGAGASQTRGYCWAVVGYAHTSFPNVDLLTGIPDLILPPGYRIRTVTTVNFFAGDAYSALFMMVEEYFSGPGGYSLGPQDEATAAAMGVGLSGGY